MRARAVIGANFGDEGKGLVTDYLCATYGAEMVVRFNGGAQAGHTVVTPDGDRHIFSHFGSGTLCGVPTFLSQFFVCNPILFLKEFDELVALGIEPTVYAHPNCLVTTFADMIINQKIEDARDKRHGSCGIGVNETIMRSDLLPLKITMSDLWNNISLKTRLSEICGKYAEFRCGEQIGNAEAMIVEFERRCERFASLVHPLGIAQCKGEILFEGAQGLLLDQDNKEFFPHLTRSNTGMKNVRTLCAQAGIDDVDIYYVSRTYLTRHGAGPLPGETPTMQFDDETNTEHPYQGRLRFAPLDMDALMRRCAADAESDNFNLVLTHCDQLPPKHNGAHLHAAGPSRLDIEP